MTGFADYHRHDGLALAQRVAAGEVTPQALLAAAIERAEQVDPVLNALSAKLYERARESLATVPERGLFAGVPFLLKDASADLAGTATTSGSQLFADRIAQRDSTLVERYRRAGLVIFGKTTTPEMSLAASTETSLTGATRNPWDITRTAGGSSGGAAAAVAAGIVPVAHASDGGGSIRIPASCCGLFGFKPTRARTPAGPAVGEGWGSLSAAHVVSRSVRDSAAMLDATHGPAPGDPYCAPHYAGRFRDEVETEPRALRIAFQRTPLRGTDIDAECTHAAERAGELLETLGHGVEEVQPPGDWEELGQALWVLVASNVAHTLHARARELGRELARDDVDRVTWSTVEFSASLSVEAYPEALRTIHRQGRRMATFHEDYDVIMSPTLGQVPVPLGVQHTNNQDLEAYRRALARFTPFTQLFNMTGQPSASLPLHWTDEGLPVGVMVSAAFGEDALLFRLAGQLERAAPWFDRTPTSPQPEAMS